MNNSLHQQSVWKKLEKWEETWEVADLDPVRFHDWNVAATDVGPTSLYTAAPMMSQSTGTRPKGESMRLHGVWWKIEPWTSLKIQRDSRSQFSFMDTMGINTDPYFYIYARPNTQQTLKTLTNSIDKALRSGMTKDQISLLIDTRLVFITMED
jgi:hypothetical protein